METFILNQPYIDANMKAYQADTADMEQVLAMLLDTAKWLKQKGSTQWNDLLDGYDKHGTADAIKRGEVFLFKDNNHLAGMVILLQKPSQWDIDLWGDDNHENSIYLHRLVSNRKYGGRQLGRKILTWTEKGIQFSGKNQIRLDCIGSNLVLNKFYKSMGYEFKGESPAGYSKYEKKFSK